MREFDGNDYRTYRQYFLSNQHALNILKDNNPRLANSILNDNDETFRNVYEEEVGHLLREQAEKNRYFLSILVEVVISLKQKVKKYRFSVHKLFSEVEFN